MLSCAKGQAVSLHHRSRDASGVANEQASPASSSYKVHQAQLEDLSSQPHGFGDLPWHVLEVVMSHVVGAGDVDTVRSARLVCRSWREAMSVNVTAAVLRPLTRGGLDIDHRNRPIVNHALDGLRAPQRAEYVSVSEAVLESGYAVFVPDPEPAKVCEGDSLQAAEAAQGVAQEHWESLKKRSVFPDCQSEADATRSDSIGHYPIEVSTWSGSDSSDTSSSEEDSNDDLPGSMAYDQWMEAPPPPQQAEVQSVAFLEANNSAPLSQRRRWDRLLPRLARNGNKTTDDTTPHGSQPADHQPLADAHEQHPGHTRAAAGTGAGMRARRRAWLRGAALRHNSGLPNQVSDPGAATHAAHEEAPLRKSSGTVVVHNDALDAFAMQLRQRYGYNTGGDGDELPSIVLRVASPSGGASATAGVASAAGSADGGDASSGSPLVQSRSVGGGSPLATTTVLGGSPLSSGNGGARRPLMGFLQAPGRSRSAVAGGGDDVDGESDAVEDEVLLEREQQVVDILTRGDAVDALKVDAPPPGQADGAAAVDADNEIAAVAPSDADLPECRGYPTPRCALLHRPSNSPVSTRVRKHLIATQYSATKSAFVSLAPLAAFQNLRSLSLRQGVYGVDAQALAALTALTHLSVKLQRRDRFGIGKSLRFLPPPRSHAGVWEAITELSELRSLDLSHSQAIAPTHVGLLTGLSALESLNLTGVQMPVASLAAFQCLTTLTQLRIPNVTIVSEQFMQLIGERRTVPRVAELIASMPQLRHLDLYWEGLGDNQSIMKDPKHMRTLARATQLRRLDVAKVAQVSDRTLDLLSPLTGLTALKLGCNAWDLYPLTGRAFVMFRTWRSLRILHLEACRNLQKDAFIAVAFSCPQLEVLHLDTSARVTPAAFNLAHMMPALNVLELVELTLVPDATVRSVCSSLLHLRPGSADHIIALKRCGGHNLGKFGEKIPGGFLGKMLA